MKGTQQKSPYRSKNDFVSRLAFHSCIHFCNSIKDNLQWLEEEFLGYLDEWGKLCE